MRSDTRHDQPSRGLLINVASGAGKYGISNMAIYSASKFGVVGFSEALARALKSLNINVSCVCPEYVRTDLINIFPKTLIDQVNIVGPETVALEINNLINLSESPTARRFSLKTYLGRILHG
jgi:short-subunit dehydrogenase